MSGEDWTPPELANWTPPELAEDHANAPATEASAPTDTGTFGAVSSKSENGIPLLDLNGDSRTAGLSARAARSGAADLAGLPQAAAEGWRSLVDPGGVALDRMQRNADPRAYKPALSDFVHPDKWAEAAHYFADQSSDKDRLPTPETPAERIGSKAIEAVPSAVLAPEAPIAAGISNLIGGGTSQAVKEAGGGPLAQTIAGLVAGSGPATVKSAVSGGLKKIARGDNLDAVNQRLSDAAETGTQLNAAQAGDSMLVKYLTALSGKAWGGGPIVQHAEEQTRNLGSYVDTIVRGLAGEQPATPTTAGNAIIEGVGTPKKLKDGTAFGNMRNAEKAAEDNVDNFVPQDHPIDFSRTLNLLDRLSTPTAGAENVTGSQVSPIITNLRDNLKADIESNARRGVPRAVNVGVGPELPRPVNTRPTPPVEMPSSPSTASVPPASDTTGLSGMGITPHAAPAPPPPATNPGGSQNLIPEPVTRPAAWDQPPSTKQPSWQEMRAMKGAGVTPPTPPPAIPYGAARSAKTSVGNSIDWGLAGAGGSNGALKAVYLQMRDDIAAGASELSPKAEAAVANYNKLFAQNQETRKQLIPIIDNAGGPEAVYQAATSGLKYGATKINRIMGAINPDQQNLVRATILDRLGRANAGAEAPFNVNTFLTNWNKNLSSEAKDALFGSSGAANEYRNNLDSLTRTIANIQRGTVMKNPSGTGEVVAHGASAVALWEGLKDVLKGSASGLGAAAGGILGNRWLAGKLVNPATVKWMASATKAPVSALPNMVNQLAKLQDPEAQSLAAYLLSQQQPDRIARASGGAVNEDALVQRLINRWKAAKRVTDASTKPLLNVPDEAIVHALNISKAGL